MMAVMRAVKWSGAILVLLLGSTVLLSEKDEVVVVRTGSASSLKESRIWVVDGPDGPLIRGAAGKTWVANVRANPAIALYREGRWQALRAIEVATPAAKALAHERMLEKYGVAERMIAAIYGIEDMVVFRLDAIPITGLNPATAGGSPAP